MDGSFLSQSDVIEASRRFVCIRLATYEDKEEAAILKSLFRSRSGALENTTYALLSPNGKERLSRTGRSPDFAFGSGSRGRQAMVSRMNELASGYEKQSNAKSNGSRQLPKVPDVRLAMNIASCDNQPLVIAVGKDKSQQKALEATLAKAAWKKSVVGQYQYTSTRYKEDLTYVDGVRVESGYLVVQPGQFGLSAKVLGQLDAKADASAIAELLVAKVIAYKPYSKSSREHISSGTREGIEWETLLPVTDPQSRGR